ncbi:uncharacterized protein I206_104387 [Kwoniella pini CBS 10737]|uniref:Oxidoreductase AflY n=1 Tax=Kwoniella pini CBS 10737 TaxID=1296096 RepID=A0A1B9I243_9TREE|nr:uncharacterized protein I206_04032 [Kwoniella pini CBS 10737]OCF49511.1 hypothetical protein I206_04032 [Kwoniella pini CBS 10737]
MSSTISKDYPPSTAEPSRLFKFPGITWESTKAVRDVLEENDRMYDIYENKRFQHNHFPHSALTRYALGASPKLIKDTLEHDKPHLLPLDPEDPNRKHEEVKDIPEKIDHSNWGDRKYVGMKGAYSRYLSFFHEEIAKNGPIETMNKYVFSPSANYEEWKTPEGDEKEGPLMIDRLVGGVFHPFIHVGFGLEFNDKVTLAEGLAETAIHSDELNHPILTSEYVQEIMHPSNPIPEHLRRPARDIPNSEDCLTPNCAREPRLGRSLLEIYSILLHSDKLEPALYDESLTINDRIKFASSGDKAKHLRELSEEWSLTDEELSNEKDGWHRKFEEIAILVTLLAFGTGRKGKELKIDFFLMHTLTSSIFIPSYMPVLSIPNRRLLLRAYLVILLNTALARGRPAIDPDLIMSYDLYPAAPGSEKAVKAKEGNVIGKPEEHESRNSWLSMVESSLAYTDSHVPKAIRSLLYFSTLYGATRPGCFIGSYLSGGQTHETIPGLAKIDGSVFVRAAGAIMNQMGWTREGQEKGDWAMNPIGYDEVWK